MREFLIVFRESFEIVLILGIVLIFLAKEQKSALMKWVWYGGAAALSVSAIGGWGMVQAKAFLKETGLEKLTEALLLFGSAILILYIIIWLGRTLNPVTGIKAQLQNDISTQSLFFLSFLVVVREGLEAVVFLSAGGDETSFSLIGSLIGAALAVGIGLVMFRFGQKMPLKFIFNASNITLIILAAGMMAYGTHEMEEYLKAGFGIEEPARAFVIIPRLPESPELLTNSWYNCSGGKCTHILHEKGTIGAFFKSFTGYNTDPSFIEIFMWAITLITGIWLWRKPLKPQTA